MRMMKIIINGIALTADEAKILVELAELGFDSSVEDWTEEEEVPYRNLIDKLKSIQPRGGN